MMNKIAVDFHTRMYGREVKALNATIYDVASEAGVSMATVSRVVNGNPNVKPSTRKKVLDAIERLGYRPNAIARGLARRKTTTVGVIIPDISSIFFSELARGIEDIATMYDYNMILCNSDQNKDKEIHLFNTLLEKQVDGIVFMGGKITEEHLSEFNKSPAPVVLAATVDEQGQTPSVNIDYKQAVYDAVSHFIEQGHTKIGMISAPVSDPINGHYKLEGYQRAIEEAGISFDDRYVAIGDYTYDSGMEAMNTFIAMDDPPTAVFVGSDEMGIGVIHSVRDAGYDVPGDFEVIGFNNTRLSRMVRPTLTTVAQPMYDIGAVAMRLLTKYMNDEKVDDHVVVLPHHVEFRDSTRA